METLIALRGPDLLRIKGLLNLAGSKGPVVFQAVQHLIHPPVELAEWPDKDRSQPRRVHHPRRERAAGARPVRRLPGAGLFAGIIAARRNISSRRTGSHRATLGLVSSQIN